MNAAMPWPRRLRAGLTLGILVLLGACAMMSPPQPGQPRDAVLQAWGAPTGRYMLPEGGERLEYATGPFGRVTWMVDLDRTGRVVAATQVLNEMHFLDLMARAPGMTREQVLFEMGRPGETQAVGWRGDILWSWRYPTNDCLLFQVQFTRDGKATSAGYNRDPSCDPPSDWR
jgi:hypothetical protein